MSEAWSVGWDSFLASSLGYILVRLDVSGRGYSGDKCRKSVYRRLGELETRDILEVIRSVLCCIVQLCQLVISTQCVLQ